jgi:hypothetical protein
MPNVDDNRPVTLGAQEQLDFLAKVHDQSVDLLEAVKFDKNPYRDGYLLCLYASMVELCGGIVLLIEYDRKTALSPVFRTFLEAYVDFKNTAEDRAYVKFSHARHHKDWIKVLRTKANPFLASILAHHQLDASLQGHEADLKELKAEGIHPLKVDERFAKAGMTDEYLSVYHFESDAIHNSWQAMIVISRRLRTKTIFGSLCTNRIL